MAVVGSSVASSKSSGQPIVVDPAEQLQTWEGWGTSLAWWSHVVGGYPEPLRSELVGKAIDDLKLNIVRYNIGGGEAPGLSFMEPRAAIPGFLRADGTYDWSTDKAQRWVLDRARSLGADRLEAFSNSPPYFMTISGSVTGGAEGTDNLRAECLGPFATYLATVVKHFAEQGIRFQTLDPMNEPAAHWWHYGNRQEGCRFSPGKPQSDLILATDQALRSEGLGTQVSACDESWTDWAASSWDALSPEARAVVAQINTHTYGGHCRSCLHDRSSGARKRLWVSEYGDGDATGMKMAHEIVRDIRDMQAEAWVYWQVIDHGGWGCLDLNLNERAADYRINRKYYAFAQFTRFLRPGCRFLGVGDSDCVCALHGRQLSIVAASDSDRTLEFDLTCFRHVGPHVVVYQTSAENSLKHLPEVRVEKGRFSLAVPAQSVTTFVIENCSAA